MPKIVIDKKDDRRLERIAPAYLRGQRRTTQRIRWAINELEARLSNNQHPHRKAG